MAAVTKGTLRPVLVPGYEYNDKGQAKVAIAKGDLLIIAPDVPASGHEMVWDKAPVSTAEPAGIALKDAAIGATVSAGIQGEMDGYTGLSRGNLLYPSAAVAGGIDTAVLAASTPRIRAVTATRIRYAFV